MARLSALAVAALAALVLLLTVYLGTPMGAGANPCDPDPTADMHEDYHGIACGETGHDDPHVNEIEVDGGRDRELVFRVYPPSSSGYLDANDQIEISLPEFDLSNASFPGTVTVTQIALDDSGDGTAVAPNRVDVSGETLTLTIPDLSTLVDVGEYLIIEIAAGAGILTPDTPSGFDAESEGYPVEITFLGDGNQNPVVAADVNIVVVVNPVSSTVPGATVRMELKTHASLEIGNNEEIVLDFSGPSEDASFDLPTTITPSRIKIRSMETFDPADVLVQGHRVILTVPDDETVAQGDFTISISQLARIKNPFAAGHRVITISSFVPHFDPDEITAVIRRTTTVSPLEGPRGSEFSLEGKGYAPGTVTVFDGEDDIIDPGETLASVKTSRGSFSVDLTARGTPGEPAYMVRTRDSNGVVDRVEFEIRSSMTFEPSTVGIGDTLRITIVDWEDEHQEVAAVRIGGIDAHTATPVQEQNCFLYQNAYYADESGTVTFAVTVPEGVPPGEQTVAVYGHEELTHLDIGGNPVADIMPCADVGQAARAQSGNSGGFIARVEPEPDALVEKTVEIATQVLTVTPASAVRGQRVTITGSEFSQSPGDDISSISVNGREVAEDPSQFEVSHNGDFSATVTVPLGARTGENEVRVVGTDGGLGTGTLTVPEPAIELDSSQGQRGTQVAVAGSGFAANGIVQIVYGDGRDVDGGDELVGFGQTDPRGNFEISFPVPLDVAIGRTHVVTAVMEVQGEDGPATFRAATDHSPPASTVETSPALVTPGGMLTVRGENFPPFAQVRRLEFAGRAVSPMSSVSTSRAGSFETRIRIPSVELGDQPLRVEVSEVVVTHIVEVGEPPLSGPPEAVFGDLVGAGVLLRVWHLERSTQEWSFYDPDPEFSEFSNLTEVKRQEVYWMHLSAPHEFQGQQLVAGWNPVPTQ